MCTVFVGLLKIKFILQSAARTRESITALIANNLIFSFADIERSGSPTIIAIQNLLAQRRVATSSISQYNGGTPNITSLRHDFTRYDPEKQLVQISTYNFSIQERSLYTGFSLDTRPKSLLVFIVSQDYAVNF